MNTTPHQSSAEEDELSQFIAKFEHEIDVLLEGLNVTKERFDGRLGDPKTKIKSSLVRFLKYHIAARDRTKAQELLARIEAEGPSRKPHLENIDKWVLNYLTYEDRLRLFDSKIHAKKMDELLAVKYRGFTIVYGKPSLEPILFEMKEASKKLGDIDNMDKEHIIQKIKGCIEHESKR